MLSRFLLLLSLLLGVLFSLTFSPKNTDWKSFLCRAWCGDIRFRASNLFGAQDSIATFWFEKIHLRLLGVLYVKPRKKVSKLLHPQEQCQIHRRSLSRLNLNSAYKNSTLNLGKDKVVDEPSLSTVTGVRGHSNVCMQLCKYVSKYGRCTGDTIILARQEHDVCVYVNVRRTKVYSIVS